MMSRAEDIVPYPGHTATPEQYDTFWRDVLAMKKATVMAEGVTEAEYDLASEVFPEWHDTHYDVTWKQYEEEGQLRLCRIVQRIKAATLAGDI